HQLCWSRVELVGYDTAALCLVLLWHAAAAWSAAGRHAGRPGCRCGGAGDCVSALCTQGHWALERFIFSTSHRYTTFVMASLARSLKQGSILSSFKGIL